MTWAAKWWRTIGAAVMVVAIALTMGKTWDLTQDNARTSRELQERDYRGCLERNKARQGNRDLVEYLLRITHSDQETTEGVRAVLDRTQPIVRCPKP